MFSRLTNQVRRTGQTQKKQQSEDRYADSCNHQPLGPFEPFQSRDHSACRPHKWKWTEGYIFIGTVRMVLAPSHTEIWDKFRRVVEAVGEIGHANGQRQLDDLPFIVELAQFLKRGRSDAAGAARHAVGVQDCGLFLLIKE